MVKLLLLLIAVSSFWTIGGGASTEKTLADLRRICGRLTSPGGECHHNRKHPSPHHANMRFKALQEDGLRRDTPKGPSHNSPSDNPGYAPADDKMRGDYVAKVGKPKKPGNPPPPAPDGTFVPDGMCDWCWNDHN